MYIKSVTIDGFKSYASYTEIGPFNSQFNAITGLNGSGKSNILDAICFVLGISNLSNVRASSLQELVFKNGQAGVTRASVSILFDNMNKITSPAGYEEYNDIAVTRQVVVGGKNKYLINGNNTQAQRIRDLFLSVHLNVNNPHFLIMQGRITKVLNMKAVEILSIVEEAVGTSLYELKKESVHKLIEKKDRKLAEIERNVHEIGGRLEILRKDRAAYLEYQKIVRENELLTKLKVVFVFLEAQNMVVMSTQVMNKLNEEIEYLTEKQKDSKSKLSTILKYLVELKKKCEEAQFGEIDKLTKLNKQLDMDHSKSIASKKTIQSELGEDKVNLSEMQNTNMNVQVELKKIDQEINAKQFNEVVLKEALKLTTKKYENSIQVFNGLTAGEDMKLDRDGNADIVSLERQLIEANENLVVRKTEKECCENDMKFASETLKKHKCEFKKVESDFNRKKNEINNSKMQLTKIEQEMKDAEWSQEQISNLDERKSNLSADIHKVDNEIESLERQIPQIRFMYTIPPGFDQRGKVLGPIASLFRVKDEKYSEAIELLGGGKLYNIVVDSNETVKLILSNGDLKRRYTFIPLNKIMPREMDSKRIATAKSLGGDDVHYTLDLLECDSKILPALKFVFGQTFVCQNSDIAKKVAFDGRILRKCITVGGDTFDPEGVVTGGARNQSKCVLEKVCQINKVKNKRIEMLNDLNKIKTEISNVASKENEFISLKHRYDMMLTQITHMENKLSHTTYGVLNSRLVSCEQFLEDKKKTLERKDLDIKQVLEQIEIIQSDMDNSENKRIKWLRDAEDDMEKLKEKVESLKKDVIENSKHYSILKKKVINLKDEFDSTKVQITELSDNVENNNSKLEMLSEKIKTLSKELEESNRVLAESNVKWKKIKQEMNDKTKGKNELVEMIDNDDTTLQETKYDLENKSNKFQAAREELKSLISKHEWVEQEKHLFGKKDSQYDTSKYTIAELDKRINQVREQKTKLSKKVNMRAMNMLGQAEDQYKQLMKRRSIVLADKDKIGVVIAELDAKKNEALRKAHEKINTDFGRIFSSLLPCANARLDPPDNQTLLDGLEIKVFLGTWKDSLSELSGGQRSLVALSLILSLLLFNPAPLYILDEVDAALDSSHTQNVGNMIKRHFKNSQFIVVSLKDGMFNNAATLFKTKFVNGVSTVSHHTNSKV